MMGCTPELSAQFITAATGRPRDILNLLPLAPPRPRLDAILTCKQQAKNISLLPVSADGCWAGSLCILSFKLCLSWADCQTKQVRAIDLASRRMTKQASHLPLWMRC